MSKVKGKTEQIRMERFVYYNKKGRIVFGESMVRLLGEMGDKKITICSILNDHDEEILSSIISSVEEKMGKEVFPKEEIKRREPGVYFTYCPSEDVFFLKPINIFYSSYSMSYQSQDFDFSRKILPKVSSRQNSTKKFIRLINLSLLLSNFLIYRTKYLPGYEDSQLYELLTSVVSYSYMLRRVHWVVTDCGYSEEFGEEYFKRALFPRSDDMNSHNLINEYMHLDVDLKKSSQLKKKRWSKPSLGKRKSNKKKKNGRVSLLRKMSKEEKRKERLSVSESFEFDITESLDENFRFKHSFNQSMMYNPSSKGPHKKFLSNFVVSLLPQSSSKRIISQITNEILCQKFSLEIFDSDLINGKDYLFFFFEFRRIVVSRVLSSLLVKKNTETINNVSMKFFKEEKRMFDDVMFRCYSLELQKIVLPQTESDIVSKEKELREMLFSSLVFKWYSPELPKPFLEEHFRQTNILLKKMRLLFNFLKKENRYYFSKRLKKLLQDVESKHIKTLSYYQNPEVLERDISKSVKEFQDSVNVLGMLEDANGNYLGRKKPSKDEEKLDSSLVRFLNFNSTRKILLKFKKKEKEKRAVNNKFVFADSFCFLVFNSTGSVHNERFREFESQNHLFDFVTGKYEEGYVIGALTMFGGKYFLNMEKKIECDFKEHTIVCKEDNIHKTLYHMKVKKGFSNFRIACFVEKKNHWIVVLRNDKEKDFMIEANYFRFKEKLKYWMKKNYGITFLYKGNDMFLAFFKKDTKSKYHLFNGNYENSQKKLTEIRKSMKKVVIYTRIGVEFFLVWKEKKVLCPSICIAVDATKNVNMSVDFHLTKGYKPSFVQNC